MNPRLALLQPYPFERLKTLFADVTPSVSHKSISLGIGEPKHATPALVHDAMTANLKGLASYPATAGEPALREAFAGWLHRRYGVTVIPLTQTLPVLGSREALFSLTQTVVDASKLRATVVCPNPFYQIYEGAALLAGAEVFYAPADPARNFAVDWQAVPTEVWQRTQLLFVCSPGNPTGAVMPLAEWQTLFDLSDQHDFVIASDECYSEIYFRDPPLGGLEAAAELGRRDFKNLIALTSLSKRSNAPGLRSGFAAGDAAIINAFLRYRTYHGSAMSAVVQATSIAAWSDETHVQANRAEYAAKFSAVLPILQPGMDVQAPDAAFYLWAGVPSQVCQGSDTEFARQLLAQYNVTVLPGSYLARPDANGHNPGAGRVRMALVAPLAECTEAAKRIRQFIENQPT